MKIYMQRARANDIDFTFYYMPKEKFDEYCFVRDVNSV
jgi:hypothetical protein